MAAALIDHTSLHFTTLHILILLLIVAAPSCPPLAAYALSTSIRTENVAGVWRLSSKVSFLSSPSPDDDDDETLLVLSTDGSFAPCNNDNDGGGSREQRNSENGPSFVLGGVPCGLWNFDVSRRELILVPNRPDDADPRNVHDTALRGVVVAATASSSPPAVDNNNAGDDDDMFLTIMDGIVAIGRCMYPRTHPNFFDEPGPLVSTMDVGTFRMVQVLGSLNTNLEDDDGEYDGGGEGVESSSSETDSIVHYCDEDFFGRRFLLTVEPLSSPRSRKERSRMEEEEDAMMPLDVRVLPVEFHGNRTFTAQGVNKILRGRFHVTNERGMNARLVMDVSLFGAGRSAPGSVYSEGKGLSHEDERTYSGQILEDDQGSQTIFVRGSVVFGTDLGSDARPEPVGIFSMMEMREK